jgi:DNA-binding GntR family transcriptional regulator
MTLSSVLSQPQRITLGAQTAEILRTSILNGELKPGQKLVERELAELMSVSQGSIREALRDLEYEGLVTKKTNTATYVTELSKDQVTEIVEVRVELEPAAFLLASRLMTPENMRELEGLLREIEAGVQNNDYHRLSSTDFRFHKQVWRLSRNATLEKMLKQLCTPLFAYLMIFLSVNQSDLKQRVKSHQLLLNVLKKGDEREIREAVSDHVRNAWFQFID